MDINEAGRTVRSAITTRRAKLADSGLEDDGTRTLIRLLDRTAVSWGGNTVTVSLATATPAVKWTERRYAANVLAGALDAVEAGSVAETSDLTYTLTV